MTAATPPPTRRWTHAAVAVVAVPVVAALAVVLWAPAAGLDTVTPWAQLAAFRVQLAGAGLVLGLLVALAPWRPSRVAAAALVVVALSPLPQVLPRAVADVDPGPGNLTLLVANVYLSEAAASDVADLATTRGADVVALPEASAEFAAEVVRLALARGVEYRSATDGPAPHTRPDGGREGPYPTSLLVRAELGAQFRPGPPSTFGAVTAVLPGPRPLTVAAVHPVAPVPGAEALWAADHAPLAATCAAGGPLVLAGDLNSTLDHSPMRAVLAAGCADAAEIAGQGLRGTWPSGASPLLRVPIDHVLLTPAAGTVTGYDVVDVAGTDHRGLLVTIRTVSGP